MSEPDILLVTGGAGFIGSNFIRYVLEKDPNIVIVNLDALTYAGDLRNINGLPGDRHILVEGNICDKEVLRWVFSRYAPNGVINFAAESHVDRSITEPDIFLQTNVLGTQALLEEARHLPGCRFMQISTDEVYGSLGVEDWPFTEESPLRPSSPYSASKASADLLVQAYRRTYGIDTVITRCSNNYGTRQYPEKMIPVCINKILNKEKIPIYGDGLQIRDWIHVLDHCAAIWEVFNHGKSGEIYNVGASHEISNLGLVKILLEEMNADESLITFVLDRPGHDRRYAIDCAKIQQDLDWHSKIPFCGGIRDTIRWYTEKKSIEELLKNH